MKKMLIVVSLFMLCFVIAIVAIYFSEFRSSFSIIRKMESGFFEVNVKKNGKVSYLFSTKMPNSWLQLKDINNEVKSAIMISEDWGFYDHKGYDLNQIKSAISVYYKKGKTLRGASTITQQLSKNLFLSSSRSFIRKIKELILAVYLEKHLSKNRILEHYFNVIEFGEGLYGIKKASFFYFSKSPADMNGRDGAFLAMLLPNPKIYSYSFREKRLTDYAVKTIDDILFKMFRAKLLDAGRYLDLNFYTFSWES